LYGVDSSGVAGKLSFHGQAAGAPVRLAADVVIDVSETEAFEPQRGTRTNVSESVGAVDNDRQRPVERIRSLVEFLDGQGLRALNVKLLVLGMRQDVHEPGAPLQQVNDLLVAYLLNHGARAELLVDSTVMEVGAGLDDFVRQRLPFIRGVD
jgi:hypothetical protein